MSLLHLANTADLEQLLPLVVAFHADSGRGADASDPREAVLPLLEGSPHGAVWLIGPRRAPVGYVAVSFGWSMEHGGVRAMIDEIYERVRGDRFKIFSTAKGVGCRHLVTEWRQYARDENGLILKKNDHCIDALFYALNGLPNARMETQFYKENTGRWGDAGYV